MPIALAISIGVSFATAITFVVVLTLSLPTSDGAYGQYPFEDPLVFPVMSCGASTIGLIAWPFVYFSIRNRPLGKCSGVILVITVGTVLLVTPFAPGLGFLGSIAAFAGSLVVCAAVIPIAHPEGYCRNCSYNLTGNVSGRCPECGMEIALPD